MALVKEIRIRGRQVVPLVLAVCTLAYLAYHALHGDRGFLAWLILKQDLSETEMLRDDLARQRFELEHRVSLLRPESLDPDMLEERAHAAKLWPQGRSGNPAGTPHGGRRERGASA